MNEYLYIVFLWLCVNRLSLNISKTVFIAFGVYSNSRPENISIQINNQDIRRVESTKYLGIYIDQAMKWETHVNYITKKTRYLLFVFAKLNKLLSQESMLIIYHALFNSIVSYGILAWGGAYNGVMSKLISLQKRIIKIVMK